MAARVSVVMGSDSDWPVMEAAVTVLDDQPEAAAERARRAARYLAWGVD